ncbi:ABC transporter permease [Anaeropeptidivorans aminofermentans]|uniref:ABC transporter permease n=1 Tax=Anaeropeptidivorans aminofermentans TaxID=2934315 RepID=UPI0020245EAC|nr:ABC transporter permease [Anaeropeptidivorans aminofermentans]
MKSIFLRNNLIYIRNKSMVFYSLFSVFISLIIYSLFIGRNIESNFSENPYGNIIAQQWLLGGILSITPITVSLSCFSIMVRDKYYGALDDFFIAPVKKYEISGGFILSSVVISLLMCIIQILLFIIIIAENPLDFFESTQFFKLLTALFISTLFGSSMSYFLSIFFKNPSTYGSANSLISTIIGFTNGVFLDLGSFPDSMLPIIKLLPTSHISVIFRNILLKPRISTVFDNTDSLLLRSFSENMGISFYIGNREISLMESLIYVFIWSSVFFMLSVIKGNKNDK